MTQQSMFGGQHKFKIDKPIRLIELFGGVGSQAMALRNIVANFEHYRLCEFDKYSIKSYNAIHKTDFKTSDITKLTAEDLGIIETDRYCYFMTYSFPCNDLSKAGQRQGMDKGSGTRSGLLWEVERLLNECENFPQVLLMENVPDVHGTKNFDNFIKWCNFLEKLGYKNYYQDLNAKNYGTAQNRNRCFMVSVLGDYYYDFPKPIKLEKRLKDYLESEVDEKYYIDNVKLNSIFNSNFSQQKAQLQQKDICDTILSRDYKDPKCVVVGNLDDKRYNEMTSRVHSDVGLSPTIRAFSGGCGEPKIITAAGFMLNQTDSFNAGILKDCARTLQALNPNGGVVINNYSIRKLTPLECWRLMNFTDEDFNKAQNAGISNLQLYKQAGNSICVTVLEHIFRGML